MHARSRERGHACYRGYLLGMTPVNVLDMYDENNELKQTAEETLNVFVFCM